MTAVAESLMESAYAKFGAFTETRPWADRYDDPALTNREKVTTILGNFHYQVENGGTVQWWDNNCAHAKGPGGRTTGEALQAILSLHADVDREVADVMMTLARFGANAGDPRATSTFFVGDDEDDDESLEQMSYWDSIVPYDEAFGRFGSDRRMAFIEAVVTSWGEDLDPFACPVPEQVVTPAAASVAQSGPRYPNVEIDLVGQDGNAYGLIAMTRRALDRAGVERGEIECFTEEAKSGDYDNVLATISRWVKTELSPTASPRPF